MSLKDLIIGAADRPTEKQPVPEWGTDVHVRVMSGEERDAWERVAFDDGKLSEEHFRAKLLVRTLCDEAGQRIFADGDAPALAQKSGVVLSRLYDAASRVNGIGKKDVDDLTK